MSDQLAKSMMVSFSKRRKGLFGKVAVLCANFDAQIAVIVVSPAGNVFTFGHSSVDQVIRRAEARNISDHDGEGERRMAGDGVRGWQAREEAGALGAWIERKLEACTTLEELQILKMQCLALRVKIVEKLRNGASFSGYEEGFGSGFEGVAKNDVSFSLGEETTPGFQGQDCMSFAMENSDCFGWENDMSLCEEKALTLPGYLGREEPNDASFSVQDWDSLPMLNDLSSFDFSRTEDDRSFFMGESAGYDMPFVYDSRKGTGAVFGTTSNRNDTSAFSGERDGFYANAPRCVGAAADQENYMPFVSDFGSGNGFTFGDTSNRNDMSAFVSERNGFYATVSRCVGIAAGQEDDMHFLYNFGSSDESTFGSSSGSAGCQTRHFEAASEDHLLDFPGHSPYGFDYENEFMEMTRAL